MPRLPARRPRLAGKPLAFLPNTDPDLSGYQALQTALHEQMMSNYKAQLSSFEFQNQVDPGNDYQVPDGYGAISTARTDCQTG